MPWRASAKAREKMPAEGPSARIGVAATVQEWPRSLEWKTRAAPGPPVANQASRLPNRVSEVLLAANEPSLGRAGGGDRDRKSTRLNSSHLGISYAVFCLKKKNTST